jgi:hypothetical protein
MATRTAETEFEPRVTPTNVIVLVDRFTNLYKHGDIIAGSALDTFSGGVSQSAALIANGTVADSTATTAVVIAAKAYAAALAAALIVDEVNRGVVSETIS